MTDGRRIHSLTNPTVIPDAGRVPSSTSPELKRYLESVQECVEVRVGRRGDPRDRAVTLRELITSGLAKELKSRPFDPNDPGSGGIETPTIPEGDTPTKPVWTGGGISATFGSIKLTWTYPKNYRGHSHTEVHRGTTNVRDDADFIGISEGGMFVDPTVTAGTTYYYWIRFVNNASVFGPWSDMVSGATLPDVNFLIGKLSGAITESELARSLRGKVITPEQQYVVKIGTATGAITGAPTTFTSVIPTNNSEVLTVGFSSLTNSGSGAVGIGDVIHITGCSSLGGNITQAVLQQRYSVNTINYSANTLTIIARTASTGIGAGDTILANTSDSTVSSGTRTCVFYGTYVSGFGLANSSTEAGTVQSQFIVAADKFAVIKPSGYNGVQQVSPEDEHVPFAITTSNEVIDGVSIPAGVYIKEAFINKARILDLIAGAVKADFISVNQMLSAPYMEAMTINMGQFNKNSTTSNTSNVSLTTAGGVNVRFDLVSAPTIAYNAGDTLRCIRVSDPLDFLEIRTTSLSGTVLYGDVVFGSGTGTPSGTPAWTIEYGNPGKWSLNNVNTRYTDFSVNPAGTMHAAYGQLRGMSILAADGSVLMRSGGASAGAGGNLLDCGDFIAESNSSGGVTAGEGWTTSGSGTANFDAAAATVSISTGTYIDQVGFFPITNGENLYIQIEGTGLTTANCVVTIMGHTSAKVYVNSASISAAGGNWDVDASGTALFAKKTLTTSPTNYFTSTTGTQFGQIRISTPSGQTAPTLKSVWIGRSPKTISGNYAATYIRDAAVDTLQIKGNAVTIQTVATQSSNVTLSSGGAWTHVLSNSFNPESGGYVALFAGELVITDDNRCDFQMKVTPQGGSATVVRSWMTGVRVGGGDAEGEIPIVMGYAQGSTTGSITVTVEARFGTGSDDAIVKNSVITIDGSKR